MKAVPAFIFFTSIDANFFVSYIFVFLIVYGWPCVDVAQSINCTVPKYCAAVDYTLIGVEPHGPTQGVWPIAVVAMIANHIWKHSVFKVMHKHSSDT